ncbi:hypothetical protein SCAR479_13061 [Seiridium cardinale]|uniref:Uncharacterized protein n=1 Tax=Seiridium cardinale TaxID=138064 RepID=A0ABR2X8Y9_9PEZI
MAPCLALSANALVTTILGLVIAYGVRFSKTVHVDGQVGQDAQTRCLFIGDCKAVNVDHCFGSPQVMIIVLALGGILVADFTLWAYSLQSKHLEKYASEHTGTGLTKRFLRVGCRRPGANGQEEDTGTSSNSQGRESSTLLFTVLSALSCASALALFAPHKATLDVQDPLTSYPAKDYTPAFRPFIQADEITNALSEFLVDSAATTRDVAVESILAGKAEAYDRQRALDQAKTQRTHRIGDTTYKGLRTQGIGANMASFNEYFLSSRDKLVSLGKSQYSEFESRSRMSRNSNQIWMVATDYHFDSLKAEVYGTDIYVTCEDVTHLFDFQWVWGKVGNRTSSKNWKPSPKGLIQFEVSSQQYGMDLQIVHAPDENVKVTHWLEDDEDHGGPVQYIVITDLHPDGSGPVTVLRCVYMGQDFLANIVMESGIVERAGKTTGQQTLASEQLAATTRAVTRTLDNAMSSLSKALIDVNNTKLRPNNHKNSRLRKLMTQDILTDLAQAYWSLMRQQIEISLGMGALGGLPKGVTGNSHGQLHGTYTRLGGSAWGLIMPSLLLLLPVIAMSRLLLLMVRDIKADNAVRDAHWQALIPSEEYDIDYIDSPPPMPPPKDDEDEPPPPYAVN